MKHHYTIPSYSANNSTLSWVPLLLTHTCYKLLKSEISLDNLYSPGMNCTHLADLLTQG